MWGATLTDPSQRFNDYLPKDKVVKFDASKTDFISIRNGLVLQIKEIDIKIAYLDQNKLEFFEENEFRIYQALTIIEETTDKMERTRRIAALVKELQ